MKYQNLSPRIKFYSKKLLKNKEVLITALDGVKAISRKLNKYNTKFINPLVRVN